MNTDRIYREYKDEALAKQITASEYSTFVAMPFEDRDSYHSREIYTKVIQAAADQANQKNTTKRKFAKPKRIDDENGTAVVITEEIIVRILESHIYIADLTFKNPGVILETGIAMGLNPNKQIILMTQGDLNDLHFDIRNNNVISYNSPDSVDKISSAFISAAESFESNCTLYIESVSKALSADATICLNKYGRLRRDYPDKEVSLHRGFAKSIFNNSDIAEFRYDNAIRELLTRRLIWTDYHAGGVPEGDVYGMHATDIGWPFIEHIWKDLSRQHSQNT